MLSLLYMAILAIPLTLLALAFLIIAVRSVGRGIDARAERRRDATPLAPPPSEARTWRISRPDVRGSLARALDPDAPAPSRRVAAPRRPVAPVVVVGPRSEEPAPGTAPVREPLPDGVPTKRCPDCAETVLAAARICKHCRFQFEGWDELLRDVG